MPHFPEEWVHRPAAKVVELVQQAKEQLVEVLKSVSRVRTWQRADEQIDDIPSSNVLRTRGDVHRGVHRGTHHRCACPRW